MPHRLLLLIAPVIVAFSGALVGEPASLVIFPVKHTVVETGHSRAIAFQLRQPAVEDRQLPVRVSDAGLVALLDPPRILAGQQLGWLRVRGLKPGVTQLRVGDARLQLEVVPERWQGRPQIRVTTPVAGAHLWGEVTAGAELSMQPGWEQATLWLELDGQRLACERLDASRGLAPRVSAQLVCQQIGPGPHLLQAIAQRPTDGKQLRSPMVPLTVIDPGQHPLLRREAEAQAGYRWWEKLPEEQRLRANERQLRPVPTRVDPAASGGEYAVNNAPLPPVVLPLDVPEGGARYQLIVRARGTFAGGAFPSVGLNLDLKQEPPSIGSTPLVTEGWHRVAVGPPFSLKAGPHHLAPLFLNDFWAPPGIDRNLHLDRVELCRLDSPDGEQLAAAGSGMMGSMDPMMGMDVQTAGAVKARLVHVAFERPLDGMPLMGALEVKGYTRWSGEETEPAPTVELWVNGRRVASQRAAAPRFFLLPDRLRVGENTVQLRARLGSGETAETPRQRVTYAPPKQAEWPAPARRFHRFTVHDPAWDPAVPLPLHPEHHPPEKRSAGLLQGQHLVLRLPPQLTGRVKVALELRGNHNPQCEVVLYTRTGDPEKVGTATAPNWWDTREVGLADLPRGPKRLHLEVLQTSNKKQRLDLMAVLILEEPATPDGVAPAGRLLYPQPGQEVYGVDAVVAEVADDWVLEEVRLVVDGRETDARLAIPGKAGRVVLPLLLRELAPGRHTVAVRARDKAGNVGITPPVEVVVADRAPSAPGPYRRALHLLKRLSFGVEAQELGTLLVEGEEAWLAHCLASGLKADRTALERATNLFPAFTNGYHVSARAATHSVLTARPARTRLVHWLKNHFSTYLRKVGAMPVWVEFQGQLELGGSTFHELLWHSATSPAMLLYLDQSRSFARNINENYAREIMELHTLGVDGGYTQADVTALAHLLAGWLVSYEADGRAGRELPRRFRFDPQLAEREGQRFLGWVFDEASPAGRANRATLALELLVAHPATARFVATKLVEHYVSLPADPALVDRLAGIFQQTYGDVAAMLQALVEDPAFWATLDEPRVTGPWEFAVFLARAGQVTQPWQVIGFLNNCGRSIFDCPTPDGYPEEPAAQIDTNGLMARWGLAKQLEWNLAGLAPNHWRWPDQPIQADEAQRIVDYLAVRLTGWTLEGRSNAAALQLLEDHPGTREERVRALAVLMAAMPEAQEK